jgi:RNA polymerase sigma-70 factor (ECF subfamily)
VSRREDEFERVTLCHSRSLLRVARRLSANAWTAEDLVQDCLLLAWRNFHQLQPGTNARAWLFRILFNVFYGEGRRLRRTPEVVPLSAEVRIVAPSSDRAMQISQALDSLPVDHRTVLLLGVVEGFTCSEMAEILGIPIGTVMSRLSRARQSMRKKLMSHPKESLIKESR